MDVRQLRNATILLTVGPHRLVVDPMLSAPGKLPGFKVFGGGRRANPLVALPAEVVERLQPDVSVCPAGAANMGLGGDILFPIDELVALAKVSRGQIFANRLEALDHCPTTRAALRERLVEEGLEARVHVPEDGDSISFEPSRPSKAKPRVPCKPERPGPYKWITAPFGGT